MDKLLYSIKEIKKICERIDSHPITEWIRDELEIVHADLESAYENLLNQHEFTLVAKTVEGQLEKIADMSFSAIQLSNLKLLQPLDRLTIEEMDQFCEEVSNALNPNENNLVLIIPYNIKAIQVSGIIPKQSNKGDSVNDATTIANDP